MANRGNETAEERRKLPKNIRQIGETGRGDRVYLEDYAVTFLRQTKAAVLLGEICSIEGHTYYFVNGGGISRGWMGENLPGNQRIF